MGIRVLFIYPNTFGMNMLPPAIALFSALLKREGHEVKIFDSTYYDIDFGVDSDGNKMERLNVVPYDMGKHDIRLRTTDWREDLRELTRSFAPDLIAMSSTEDMWLLGAHLLEAVADHIRTNRVPVIVGGVFATFAPELVLRHPLVDMACVGEGENAMVDLCGRIQAGRSWDDVTNLWVKGADGSITRNRMAAPVDVDANPMIDVSLFEEARLYRPMSGRVYKMLPVETIRGCPYQCAYCNSPNQMQLYRDKLDANFMRKRRMEHTYQELKHYKDTLGIEYVYFWADTFLALSKSEFDEFCEMYSDIRLPFWMQTRPETITEEKIAKLAKVGLHRISFGLEHGNEAFRAKHLRRSFPNADIIERLKVPHRYDVQFSVNNITGFPHETRELAMDTVELNRLIDADNQNIYAFVPFHGTPLRTTCEDLGLVAPDDITRCLTDRPMLRMPQYPIEEIEGLQKCFVMYVKFPKSRWPDIRRAEANTPEGERIFAELKEEYFEKYFVAPKDNPHALIPGTADLEYGATPL